MDSHIVIRNNVEGSHIAFAQFSPVVTFCRTIVEYYTQDVDIGTILPSYSDFPSFTCAHFCVCVCVCVFSPVQFCHVCRLMYPPAQSRYQTVLCGQFVTTPLRKCARVCAHTHPHPSPWQPLIWSLFPFSSPFCHFKNVI